MGVRALTVLVCLALLVPAPARAQEQGPSRAARSARLLRTGDGYLASGDRGSAIGYFREAVQADPSNSSAYLALGDAYRARGSLSDARAVIEAGLMRSPDVPVLWLLLVRTLRELGDHAQAAVAVRSLLARDPQSPEGLRLRAALARERGAWSEALTAYRALLAADLPLSDEERAEAVRYEAALRLLAHPLDPVSAPRACRGSPLRRTLARCR